MVEPLKSLCSLPFCWGSDTGKLIRSLDDDDDIFKGFDFLDKIGFISSDSDDDDYVWGLVCTTMMLQVLSLLFGIFYTI